MIAEASAVTERDICSARKDRAAVEARWIAMWITRQVTRFSYPDIGRAFGDRDHTTVMHAVAGMAERMAADIELSRRVLALQAAIEGRQQHGPG